MHPLEQRILQFIERNGLISPGDSIIVAVSGGPDSVALFSLLAKIMQDCSFVGVHVNHNLRPGEARSEKALVEQLCRLHDIPFEYVSVDVAAAARKHRHSLEACARSMRYQALEEIRQQHRADLIAVGHTRDDQAEQFFIRLIRGSGLKGLGGMTPKRGRVVRPLLQTGKAELVSYLADRNIDYCLDSSNTSRRFLRNKVRLDLLPLLEQGFNPAIKQTIVNSMTVLRDEDDFLEELVITAYRSSVSFHSFKHGSATTDERRVTLETLQACHPALRRRLYEKLCWQSGRRPTFRMISSIDSLCLAGRSGSRLHLPGSLRVIKSGEALIFSVTTGTETALEPEEMSFGSEITIPSTGSYHVPSLGLNIDLRKRAVAGQEKKGALVVDGDLVEFPLVLRQPRAGERFKPLGAPGRKKISRFLSDRKIPRHLRYRFPVLVSGNTIVALPGLIIDDDYKTKPATNHFLQISCKDDSPLR